MSNKLLIIGLDGGTFDVIDPLIKEGLLPNLAGLIAKGVSGRIVSTVPPVSGPAWVSLATGMKPQRTSIYDFSYRKGKSYELQSVSSSDYAGRAVWDYLGKAGKKIGILNYPMCIPPYEVNGFLSAGLLASKSGEFTFPPELKQELNELAGGEYELDPGGYHNIRYEDTGLFLDDLQRVLIKKLRVATHLIKEKQWDFFWFVISETDWLQHIMWRHLDETHPLYEGENSRKLHERFKKIWGLIDEAIGEFSAIVGEQSNIVVHSDHGFGPNKEIFKLNVWLEREGYLAWRKGQNKASGRVKEEAVKCCRAIAKRIRLDRLAPRLYGYGRAARHKLTEKVIDQIDIEKSIAFDPGHTVPFGGIYINERLTHGPQRRQELGREIAKKLHDWGNVNSVKVETWQKHVDQANTGPDVLVGINDWGCVLLKDRLDGEVFDRRPYSSRHTGSHRMDGIFVAAGPDIQNCRVGDVQLCDIAPTVLHLFDVPTPRDMDGHVRTDVITAEYLASHPVTVQDEIPQGSAAAVGQTRNMTQDEQDVIQQQLKDLGYL